MKHPLSFLFRAPFTEFSFTQSDYILSFKCTFLLVIPDRGKGLSLFRTVQTGFEVHTSSYPVGTGGFFCGVKAARV
jgi:hypothetical protein